MLVNLLLTLLTFQCRASVRSTRSCLTISLLYLAQPNRPTGDPGLAACIYSGAYDEGPIPCHDSSSSSSSMPPTPPSWTSKPRTITQHITSKDALFGDPGSYDHYRKILPPSFAFNPVMRLN
uniref:Ig-like domain-containing protein n=1 Tax=Anopheles coluzzii TaxID=1518534 RepID=A0A8W7PF12_ANOCL